MLRLSGILLNSNALLIPIFDEKYFCLGLWSNPRQYLIDEKCLLRVLVDMNTLGPWALILYEQFCSLKIDLDESCWSKAEWKQKCFESTNWIEHLSWLVSKNKKINNLYSDFRLCLGTTVQLESIDSIFSAKKYIEYCYKSLASLTFETWTVNFSFDMAKISF